MSSLSHGVDLIVEWSPQKLAVFDVAARTTKVYDFGETLPYAGKTAILAISRRSVFVRATRVPNAAPEEIRQVVQVKLAELFPLPPHELAYDFMPLSDVNAEGRLALIMAMSVAELRRAKQKLAGDGIKVSRTLPLALAAPLITESLGLTAGAVVEATTDFASVDLVEAGILRYSRVIPRSAQIDLEVSRTYNASGLTCATTIASGPVDYPQADRKTQLSSLEALASGNLDRFKVNIELPEVIQARELGARKTRSFIAGAFLLASFGAAYIAYSDWSDIQTETAIGINKEEKIKEASDTYNASAQSLQKKVVGISTILTGAFHPAQTVSDITTLAANCAPAQIWLTGINVERGKEITIRGVATTSDAVSKYVDALNDYADPVSGQPRFRDAKFLFANNGQAEKTPVVDFSVSAFPIGNLPIALQQKAGGS